MAAEGRDRKVKFVIGVDASVSQLDLLHWAGVPIPQMLQVSFNVPICNLRSIALG